MAESVKSTTPSLQTVYSPYGEFPPGWELLVYSHAGANTKTDIFENNHSVGDERCARQFWKCRVVACEVVSEIQGQW